MKSRLTDDFIGLFAQLPPSVQDQARKAYRQWLENPQHPGLRFKRIHSAENIYSVRIGLGWRALGLLDGNVIYWFWIGSHAEYDRILG